MLGQLPLFLCKPLRYQVSKQFTFYHYLFVFYTSRCTADWALFGLYNLETTMWTITGTPPLQRASTEASGNLTFKRTQLSSRPVILCVFCLQLKPSLPASHGPPLSQTKPSSLEVDGPISWGAEALRRGDEYAIKQLLRVITHRDKVETLTSRCNIIMLMTTFLVPIWKITFLLCTQHFPQQ